MVVRNISISLGAFLLYGCSPTITNLTPQSVPKNPSNTYRLTMRSDVTQGDTVQGTFKPIIIIDGQEKAMMESPLGKNFFFYDYDKMPREQNRAIYYYQINYDKNIRGNIVNKQVKSKLYNISLLDRYGLSLVDNRAPVGAKIDIVGKGFNENDKVIVGKVLAETEYVSGNVISFIVPEIIPNNYNVYVSSNAQEGTKLEEFVGNLIVDSPKLTVDVESIKLEQGGVQEITFSLSYPSNRGGLAIDVTTDIPDSIIMPEVVIPEGESSVSVDIEGGEAGEGNLYVNARGFQEISIPVEVKSSQPSQELDAWNDTTEQE